MRKKSKFHKSTFVKLRNKNQNPMRKMSVFYQNKTFHLAFEMFQECVLNIKSSNSLLAFKVIIGVSPEKFGPLGFRGWSSE